MQQNRRTRPRPAEREAIAVYRGAASAERFATDAEDLGPLASVVRTVQKALGDEAERLDSLNDALDAGAYVVTVPVLVDADDEDAQLAERGRFGDVLLEHGARDVAFYGKWTITQLEPGAS